MIAGFRKNVNAIVVILANCDSEQANLVDISDTGARFTSSGRLSVGEAIALQFEDGARVSAEVARVEPGFAAARFLDDAQTGAIDRYAA
jgi:methyl-accepting chemotaxis protein